MKLVTFAGWKGGTGKTTALMAATSALIKQGRRVTLFEADENRPIARWQENAKQTGTWSDGCQIEHVDDLLEDLTEALRGL